ncbi:hypothetical protein KZ843_21720, partial [Pseudomonas aeruginosa]
LAGLLALASVLGVGEGHLLHRETRWAGSRYFAKSESLFQSFPKNYLFSEYPVHWAAFVSASLIQEHAPQLDRSSADSTSHSPLHYH